MFIYQPKKVERIANIYFCILASSSLVSLVTSLPTSAKYPSRSAYQTTTYELNTITRKIKTSSVTPADERGESPTPTVTAASCDNVTLKNPTSATVVQTDRLTQPSVSTPSKILTTIRDQLTTTNKRELRTERPTTTTKAPKAECFEYSHFNCVDAAKKREVSLEYEPTCYPRPVTCKNDKFCFMRFTMVFKPGTWKHPDWLGGLLDSGCHDFKLTDDFQNENNGICRYVTYGSYFSAMNPELNIPYDFNFCTCSGHLCNRLLGKDKMVFKPFPNTTVQRYRETFEDEVDVNELNISSTTPAVSAPTPAGHNSWKDAFIATISVIGVVIVSLLLACFLCKACRVSSIRSFSSRSSTSSREGSLDSEKVCDSADLSDLSDLVPLNKGRYGKVYRRSMVGSEAKELAIKVYEGDDMHVWANEVAIYESSGIAHENVLRYFGSTHQHQKYYLFLEFHSHGSLLDYLTENTFKWKEMITTMHTVARGLAHLHSAMLLPNNKSIKHPIAHRDIKSSNIMLDGQLRAKIGDFNLAQTLETCRLTDKDSRQRVGTVRYMAPEILSGQANYRRESVLQADVYSMALVLWEIFSRCKINDRAVERYQPPYYEFVGDQPTHDSMLQTVSVDDKRPTFRADLTDPNVEELVSTIEDSWDKDGDTRLTAMCVELRLEKFLNKDTELGKVNTSYI